MANHGPAYGDLAQALAKRDALYDKDLEGVIQKWMETQLGEKFPDTFAASLKDGVRLCKLLNVIRPGVCKAPKAAKMPFVQMENINNFLIACKSLGLTEVDLFVTVDLYEAKNMLQVQHCLDKLRITHGGGEKISIGGTGADVFSNYDTAAPAATPATPAPTPAPQPVATPAPAPTPAAAPAATFAGAKFCPECGAKTEGARFCPECGFKLC